MCYCACLVVAAADETKETDVADDQPEDDAVAPPSHTVSETAAEPSATGDDDTEAQIANTGTSAEQDQMVFETEENVVPAQ